MAVLVPGCQSRSENHDTAATDRTSAAPDDRFSPRGSGEENNAYARQLLASLRAQLDSDLARLKQQVAATDSEQEKVALFVQGNPVPEFVDQALRLANSFPESPAAFEAALAAFGYAAGQRKDAAMNFMLDHCADRLNYPKVIDSLLSEIPSAQIESWLRKMVATAPHGPDHARALLGFKTYFDQIHDFRLALRHNAQIAQRLPAEQMDYINSDASPEQIGELERYLQLAIEQYGELPYSGQQLGSGKTYGEVAERELFDLQNLRVGMVAPDIAGHDLDGTPFRLSDYRGKIVMLDFWGHWCPPCHRMYPHERYLVQELSGLPFALIGVNSDRELETARNSVMEDRLPWRNFWNGPEGTAGPISKKWNVSEWPTVYLIDGEGVIRYRGLQGDDLNRGLEQLLAEIGHPHSLTESVAASE
jgi:thiol-disulfide isomerase/thioredoxin